jgi:predicted lipoprotein with Yx(FWY)xxD motif
MRKTLASFVVAAAVLAGCGGGDDTTTEAASSPDPTGSAASTTPSPTAASGSPTDDGPGEDEGPESEGPESEGPEDAGTDDRGDGARRTGPVVTTSGSQFGTMLFDGTGQAIYLFDKETGPRAACYGECAAAWPPVLTDELPKAAGRVREGLLGTTERRDGSTQVTYGGHPLYYYAHEGKDEVLCHDVREYGGLWLVVRPDGQPAPA